MRCRRSAASRAAGEGVEFLGKELAMTSNANNTVGSVMIEAMEDRCMLSATTHDGGGGGAELVHHHRRHGRRHMQPAAISASLKVDDSATRTARRAKDDAAN